MIATRLDQLKTILCLGAHADDIEIGCGGTILKLLRQYENLTVHWLVLGARDQRAVEAAASAQRFLTEAGQKNIVVEGFRDSFFPYEGERVKERFNQLGAEIQPDMIFTHRREDMHQDHRVVAELTWNTFRNHLILEYEIPKYEGDLGTPNVFVPLSDEICREKVETTIDAFPTQQSKPWFTADTLNALLRIRGIECQSPTGQAEAFHCRKLVL
jgi:LmbE family N-acetylglucosaminyl deacetylase